MREATHSRSSHLLQHTLETGVSAAVATTVTAVICGVMEDGKSVAPVNAVSHIVWGDVAAAQDGVSARYTATGLALNAAAVTGWAGIHELIQDGTGEKPDATRALVTGAVVSALAYFTDYYLVPNRFTPGFEKRVSNTSLLAIYSALALSLAFGRRHP